MLRFFLYLVLLSPFLVCDPQVGVEYYQIMGLPAAINSSQVPPDSTNQYGFKLDLADLPPGSYTVTAKACAEGWCSEPSLPLAFTRPQLSAPASIKVAK